MKVPFPAIGEAATASSCLLAQGEATPSRIKMPLTFAAAGALAFAGFAPLAAYAAGGATLTFVQEGAHASLVLVDTAGKEIATAENRTYSGLEMLDDRGVALKDAAPVLPGYYLSDLCVDDVCETAVMETLYDD